MYGVIDIGSNTIRLAVYQMRDRQLVSVLNKKYAAGLAGYIDESGKMSERGINRLVDILSEINLTVDRLSDCRVFPFATASLRNIENTEEVLEIVKKKCDIDVDVISGEDEARMSYSGAISQMGIKDGIFTDIGGGSTELVMFKKGEVIKAKSLNIGSLNLYRKYVDEILPNEKEIKKISRRVESKLEEENGFGKSDIICCAGGTARAILNVYNDLNGIEDNNYQYMSGFLQKLIEDLAKNPKKIRNAIIENAPERIHTFIPGTIILNSICRKYNIKKVMTSKTGVREGYLYRLLDLKGR